MKKINMKALLALSCFAAIGFSFSCKRAPLKTEIIHQDIEIESKTGLKLSGYLEGSEASIKNGQKAPLLILMHGLMDSNEFQLIRKQADAYTAEGYCVLAFDFDGHGKSEGKLIDMTISKELLDAQAIIEYAESLDFPSEIDLIGHSQGGAIASITAARHSDKISKLILLSPGGMISDNLRGGVCFGKKFDPKNPPDKAEVFDDYIGRDYIVDAMNMDLYKMAKGYKNHSVLLIRGTADPLVSEEVISKYEKIYSSKEDGNAVSCITVNDAPHDFFGYEDAVTSAVLSFLK